LEPPKVAVVGCGAWGQNLVRNFAHLGALAIACDANAEARHKTTTEFPGIKVTDSFEAALQEPGVSAVVIASPSDTHFDLAKRSLMLGKHVYVEKPLARDVKQASELDEIATRTNLVLMVGHLLLYHPAVNCLKELIASGELGELRFIKSDRMNYSFNRQHWSVLWDLAPHDISMMSYLLDCEAAEVSRVGGWDTLGDGLVDVAYLDLNFPTPGKVVPGQIRNSWIDPKKLVRLTVNGTLKTAVLNDTQVTDKLTLHSRTNANRMIVEHPYYSKSEPLLLECEHFLQCIATGERPRTDANNAYQVVRILADVEKRLSSRPTASQPVVTSR
jgi:UDP-2-acetamido-3-amino-2,3-dideoxy-glucuronate N-acetyltransferase